MTRWASRAAADCELLLLDQALNELAAFDPQQAQIVELRYFGGLTEGEIADCAHRVALDCDAGMARREGLVVPQDHDRAEQRSSLMDASSWQRVKEIVQAALARPACGARGVHRFTVCGDDTLDCERKSTRSLRR